MLRRLLRQAQARAHRIGQSRDVLVLRLLASNTIEQHILDVAEQKRKFADSSITGTRSLRSSAAHRRSCGAAGFVTEHRHPVCLACCMLPRHMQIAQER